MSERQARVLLIYPPRQGYDSLSCPLGLLVIAAVLDKAGLHVRLLDANAIGRKRNADQIVEEAREFKPDIIGMTLLTPMIKQSYSLVSRLTRLGAKLIAGGPHATVLPEEAIRHGFDAVVVGEGASTVLDATRALLGLIPKEDPKGWVYRDSLGKIQHTKEERSLVDLSDFPLPARHLINPRHYNSDRNPYLYGELFSSRGCTGRCTFCSFHRFSDRVVFRSAQSILDEICHVTRTYGTKRFYFVDDSMTQDRRRAIEICEGLLRMNLDIKWSIIARVDLVDEQLLELLARAGCYRIEYGVESGHPETLKRIRKHHTVEMSERIIRMTAKYGIEPRPFFIIGFPWEDAESLDATKRLMVDLSPYVKQFPRSVLLLIPLPGTEIYDRYKSEYAFENWWLNSDLDFCRPRRERHSFFESKVFPFEAVLDADFFHYKRNVKQKLYSVCQYMYLHALKDRGLWTRLRQAFALSLSRALYSVSPSLERWIFRAGKYLQLFAHHSNKEYDGATDGSIEGEHIEPAE